MSAAADRRGYAHPEALVSTDWLARHLKAPDLRVVDATWHMPGQGRDARGEYEARHIPGAVFFNIDEIADGDSSAATYAPAARRSSPPACASSGSATATASSYTTPME